MKKRLLFVVAIASWSVWAHSAAAGQSHPVAERSHPAPPTQTPDTTVVPVNPTVVPVNTTVVPVNTSGLPVLQLSDTAVVRTNIADRNADERKNFRITCGCGVSQAPAAIYIDGRLADNTVLETLSPKDITSLRILKSDSLEIDGKVYKGVIAIETKGGLAL